MAGKRRGGTVELPLRISLTEEGSDFFIRNRKKLSRFQLADGSEVYGLALQSASIKSMQQMIRQNYISRIEIAQSEFLNRRQQIIDFSKLIMYGLFYRNFDSLVFHRLLKSDLIRQWNRHNPGNPIDEKTRINESFLSSVLANNKAIVDEVKEEILEPVTAQINASPSLLPEEKNIQLLSCERFLQHLQPLTWYILTRYRESVDYPGLVGDIRSRLAHFIEKSKIAEYLALLIMELLANAENSNLNRRASKREKGNCSEKILHSEEFRKSLFEEMARDGEKIYLDWHIRNLNSGSASGERLEVTLFNRDSEYRDLREKIDAIKSMNMKEKSLSEVYSGTDPGRPNTGLGIYYISYLQDSCEKVGVRFKSNVHQTSEGDVTIVTLQLQF